MYTKALKVTHVVKPSFFPSCPLLDWKLANYKRPWGWTLGNGGRQSLPVLECELSKCVLGALLQERNCLAELLSLWSRVLCALPRPACFYQSGSPRTLSNLHTTSTALIVSQNQSNKRSNNSNPSQTSQQKWSQSEYLCIMRALLGYYCYWTLLYVIQLNPLAYSMKIGLSS